MYINGAKVEQNHKVQEVNSIGYSFTYQTDTLLSWSDISVACIKDLMWGAHLEWQQWIYRLSVNIKDLMLLA